MLAEDLQVHMDGNPINNPLAGTYQGLEEFEALLHKYYDIFVRDGGTLGDLTQMRLVGQEVIAWGHEYIRVPEVAAELAELHNVAYSVQGWASSPRSTITMKRPG